MYYYATSTRHKDLQRFETLQERDEKIEDEGFWGLSEAEARKNHASQFRCWKHAEDKEEEAERAAEAEMERMANEEIYW